MFLANLGYLEHLIKKEKKQPLTRSFGFDSLKSRSDLTFFKGLSAILLIFKLSFTLDSVRLFGEKRNQASTFLSRNLFRSTFFCQKAI